jgi:outer membrane protein OmpA-like peptidoglycan-associated protein
MFAKIFLTAFLGTLLAGMSAASAADLPGSKDPSFLKRYEGSEIVSYESRPYDSYNIAIPDPKNPSGPPLPSVIEGQVTRIVYHAPPGHTVLELLRNYEQALKDAGLTQTYEMAPVHNPDFATWFYMQGWEAIGNNWWRYTSGAVQQEAYITGKRTVNGQDVKIAVFLADFSTPLDVAYSKPVHFNPGELNIVVDVVSAKAAKIDMVFVKAADMADALATKGFVDLYGIYFDVDKTDVKPESSATLDEVASLLKIDRSLKLEISGHTDNTGQSAHNQKLSEGRAAAVVQALVTKYGIDPHRLVAKGYGDTKPVAPNTTDDGRAKNRRVELRKL